MPASFTKDQLKIMISEAMASARSYSPGSVKPANMPEDITDAAVSVIVDNIPEFPEEDLQDAIDQLRELLLPAVESMLAHAEESSIQSQGL